MRYGVDIHMAFSKGYQDWQHQYLIDAVYQFGLPSLFITISPSKWSFPTPFWFDNIMNFYIFWKLLCGYVCGSKNTNVFSYINNKKVNNILTYFYRFEFQKCGTLHIHG